MSTCIVCLGEENDSTNLIEYNHCGLYHIHKECLNRWKQKDECIICREKIQIFKEEDQHTGRNCCKVCKVTCPVLSVIGILIILLI